MSGILGDGDFVESVLANAWEAINKKYKLAAKGIKLDDIISATADLLSVDCESLIGPSKERVVVKARALLYYWAVHELGISMTDVAERLIIAVPTVSIAAKKGRQFVKMARMELTDILNSKI